MTYCSEIIQSDFLEIKLGATGAGLIIALSIIRAYPFGSIRITKDEKDGLS